MVASETARPRPPLCPAAVWRIRIMIRILILIQTENGTSTRLPFGPPYGLRTTVRRYGRAEPESSRVVVGTVNFSYNIVCYMSARFSLDGYSVSQSRRREDSNRLQPDPCDRNRRSCHRRTRDQNRKTKGAWSRYPQLSAVLSSCRRELDDRLRVHRSPCCCCYRRRRRCELCTSY